MEDAYIPFTDATEEEIRAAQSHIMEASRSLPRGTSLRPWRYNELYQFFRNCVSEIVDIGSQ